MTKKPKQTEKPMPVAESPEGQSGVVPEEAIGSRIRAAREARGLSQTAVANRSKLVDPKGQGVSRTVLVGYEAGQFRPGVRELRILCDTLSVTPNWLIYGTDSAQSAQASMETVRKSNLASAMRLALAISVLKPHERGAFQSLVLSMAGRELGDMRLSALLMLARYLVEPAMAELKTETGEEVTPESEVLETLDSLVKRLSEGVHTTYGNRLRISPDEDFGSISGEWLYPDPSHTPKPETKP